MTVSKGVGRGRPGEPRKPLRPDATNHSTEKIIVTVTPEEREMAFALARYLAETVAGMIRRLLREERARLVASGKKPPRQ